MKKEKKQHWNVGQNNHKWKGGKTLLNSRGRKYIGIWVGGYHPRKQTGNYVREHLLIVESVIGKYIPNRAVVHHVDENHLNNNKNNLVLCQNDSYHKLLHKRMRAIAACGHSSWLKCKFCKTYDSPENLHLISARNNGAGYHQKCQKLYDSKRRTL